MRPASPAPDPLPQTRPLRPGGSGFPAAGTAGAALRHGWASGSPLSLPVPRFTLSLRPGPVRPGRTVWLGGIAGRVGLLTVPTPCPERPSGLRVPPRPMEAREGPDVACMFPHSLRPRGPQSFSQHCGRWAAERDWALHPKGLGRARVGAGLRGGAPPSVSPGGT